MAPKMLPDDFTVSVQKLAEALHRVTNHDVGTIRPKLIDLLRDPEKNTRLVKPTDRVRKLGLEQDQVYEVFIEQFLPAATSFLNGYDVESRRAVLFGHKNQGKTQLLHFIFIVLQELGEAVVFLDKTIKPDEGMPTANVKSAGCCLQLWKAQILDSVKGNASKKSVRKSLVKFEESGGQADFAGVHNALRDFADTAGADGNKPRVWFIVDEAAQLAAPPAFPIEWPGEQVSRAFHFIITGSAGVADFVSEHGLDKWVQDLKELDGRRSAELAIKLATKLGVKVHDLFEALGCAKDKSDPDETKHHDILGEGLEEAFGGIPGHIAEFVTMLKADATKTLTDFVVTPATGLAARVAKLMRAAAKKRSLSNEQLARDWYNEIKRVNNSWVHQREAGMCGSNGPRGLVMKLMLELIFDWNPEVDDLNLVKTLRNKNKLDGGLDGSLLEMQEILQIKRGDPILVAKVEKAGERWSFTEPVVLNREKPKVWTYTEDRKCPENSVVTENSTVNHKGNWHCVLVPTGFPVLDVLVVENQTEQLNLYLVQITRSKMPFSKHETCETCSEGSKTRIDTLVGATQKAISEVMALKFYVMRAPVEGAIWQAPAHHTQSYFFSPAPAAATATELATSAEPRGRGRGAGTGRGGARTNRGGRRGAGTSRGGGRGAGVIKPGKKGSASKYS